MSQADPVLDAMATADEVEARWLDSVAGRLMIVRHLLDVYGVDRAALVVICEVVGELQSVARLLRAAGGDNYREDHHRINQ